MAALGPEDREQCLLAEWLDLTGLRWCHVPNGGHRAARTAARLKRLGVKAGVPDILIFTRSSPHVGMAIELKRARVKGEARGRTSQEQREWLSALRGLGWRVVVAEGFDEAREAVLEAYPHVAGRLRGPACAPTVAEQADDGMPF